MSSLEQGVLGFERHDDVPSDVIPQLYFGFLQTGDVTPLADVLIHNRLDILSMVALVAYMGHALAEPRNIELGDRPLSAAELYTVGRYLVPEPEGIACLEEAMYRGLPGAELRRQCSRLLATLYRRDQRFKEAVHIWEKLTSDDGLSTWAYIELAKHYEHRARDLRTARQWTMRALDVLVRRRSLAGAGAGAGSAGGRLDQEFAEVIHRLKRIERKLSS